MSCYIYTLWVPAETYFKTIIRDTGKWTGKGFFFQTLKRLLITKVPGSTPILELAFYTFKVLWALHPVDDFLDSLSVLFHHLFIISHLNKMATQNYRKKVPSKPTGSAILSVPEGARGNAQDGSMQPHQHLFPPASF